MGLFKEINCRECGEKTSLLNRKVLKNKEYVCSKCTKNIPAMIKEWLSEYSYEDYLELKEYIKYSESVLNRVFRATHHYQNLQLDQDNGLFYLDDEFPKVYLQVGNIENFSLIFDPEKLKEGILTDKVKGKVSLELEMRKPYFKYNKVIDMFAKAECDVNLLRTKVKYKNPKNMDKFIEAMQNSSLGLQL